MTVSESGGMRAGILAGAIGFTCMLALGIFLALGSGGQAQTAPASMPSAQSAVQPDTGWSMGAEDTACEGG